MEHPVITASAQPSDIRVANCTSNRLKGIIVSCLPPHEPSEYKLKVSIVEVSTKVTVYCKEVEEWHATFQNLELGTQFYAKLQFLHKTIPTRNSDEATSEPFWTCCTKIVGLEATFIAHDKYLIEWKKVPGATNYFIRYKPENGSYEDFYHQNAECTLDNLVLGKKYTVFVSAVNGASYGQQSETVTFHTGWGVPTKVKVHRNEQNPDTSIDVRFTEPKSIPHVYLVTVTATSFKHRETVRTKENFTTIAGLHPGTEYAIHVQSLDEKDTKLSSGESEIVTRFTCPDKVNDLGLAIESARSRNASWEPVVGATLYQIKLRKTGSRPQLIDIDGKKSEHVIENLCLNTCYKISITAINTSGSGKESNQQSFRTALFPPSRLVVKLNEIKPASDVDLTFEFPKPPAAKYRIRVENLHGKPDVLHFTGKNFMKIGDLNPGERYKFYVCSVNENDENLNSEEIESSEISMCQVKFLINIYKIANIQQKVWWDDVPGIKQYEVAWRIQNEVEWQREQTNQNAFILKNLMPGKHYEVKASPITIGRKGEESEVKKFTTAPSRPVNITSKMISPLEVLFTCKPRPGATSYEFTVMSETFEEDQKPCTQITQSPQFRFRCTGNDTKFETYVRAINSGGISGSSDVLKFRQVLRHLQLKFLSQAKNHLPQEKFIRPELVTIPDQKISKDFKACINPGEGETVMMVGRLFCGKTACCSYFLQTQDLKQLCLLLDYDLIKSVGSDFTAKTDIKSLLWKYMPDISSEEMDFVYQWMKEHSQHVTLVVDNFALPDDFQVKHIQHEDKETPQVLFYNLLRTNRDTFPKSHIFCTTSQSSVPSWLKPTATYRMHGFDDDGVKEMKLRVLGPRKPTNTDIPSQMEYFSRHPGSCEIVWRLSQQNGSTSDETDCTSLASVLIEILSQNIARHSEQEKAIKLRRLYEEIMKIPHKIYDEKIDPQKINKVMELNDDCSSHSHLSSVVESLQKRNAMGSLLPSCDILDDISLKALYFGVFATADEFRKHFPEGKLKFSSTSYVWIMTAGMLRQHTSKKAAKLFQPVTKIEMKECEKKAERFKTLIKENMRDILTSVYTDSHVTLDWFACCAELDDEKLLKACSLEVEVKDDMSTGALKEVTKFLENVPKQFCRQVKIKGEGTDENKAITIDKAIRKNPHGQLLNNESYSHRRSPSGSKHSNLNRSDSCYQTDMKFPIMPIPKEGLLNADDTIEFGIPKVVTLAAGSASPSTALVLHFQTAKGEAAEYFASLIKCTDVGQQKTILQCKVVNGHIFNNLQPNSKYKAVVHANYGDKEGESVASATALTAPAKAVVTDYGCCVMADENSADTFKIKWQPVPGCNLHEVRCVVFDKIESSLIIKDKNEYTHLCQHPMMQYSVQVRSRNDSGHFGDWSDKKVVDLGGDFVPQNARCVRNIEDPNTKLEVVWDKPVLDPMFYTIEAMVNNQATKSEKTHDTAFTMTQLKPGTEYTFKISAYHDEKPSAGCYSNSVVTKAAPSKLKSVMVFKNEDDPSSSLDVSWQQEESRESIKATKYRINVYCETHSYFQQIITTALKYTLVGLQPGSCYRVTVAGGNDEQGFGEESEGQQTVTTAEKVSASIENKYQDLSKTIQTDSGIGTIGSKSSTTKPSVKSRMTSRMKLTTVQGSLPEIGDRDSISNEKQSSAYDPEGLKMQKQEMKDIGLDIRERLNARMSQWFHGSSDVHAVGNTRVPPTIKEVSQMSEVDLNEEKGGSQSCISTCVSKLVLSKFHPTIETLRMFLTCSQSVRFQVQELDLSHNTSLEVDDIMLLGQIVQNFKVECLILRNCMIDSKALLRWKLSLGEIQLRKLDISGHAQLGSSDMVHLGDIVKGSNITTLVLRDCSLTPVHMEALKQSLAGYKLKKLDVSGHARLESDDMAHLGDIIEGSNITTLVLRDCSLTPVHMEALKQSLAGYKLCELDIGRKKAPALAISGFASDSTVKSDDTAYSSELDGSENASDSEELVAISDDRTEDNNMEVADCIKESNDENVETLVTSNETQDTSDFQPEELIVSFLSNVTEHIKMENWEIEEKGRKLLVAKLEDRNLHGLKVSFGSHLESQWSMLSTVQHTKQQVEEKPQEESLEVGQEVPNTSKVLISKVAEDRSTLSSIEDYGAVRISDIRADVSKLPETTLHVQLLTTANANGRNYQYTAISRMDGRQLSMTTTKLSAVIGDITPGDHYDIFVFEVSKEGSLTLVSKSQIQTAKLVGRSGGHVAVGGCSITFPKDSVEDGTRITITPCIQSVPPLPDKFTSIGPVLDLCSTQKIFYAPASCTFTTSCRCEGEPIPVFILCFENGKWEEICSTFLTNKGVVSFKCEHFTPFAVAAPMDTPQEGLLFHLCYFVYLDKNDNIRCVMCKDDNPTKTCCETNLRKSNYFPSPFVATSLTMKKDETVKFSLTCQSPLPPPPTPPPPPPGSVDNGEWEVQLNNQFTSRGHKIHPAMLNGVQEPQKIVLSLTKNQDGEEAENQKVKVEYPWKNESPWHHDHHSERTAANVVAQQGGTVHLHSTDSRYEASLTQ